MKVVSNNSEPMPVFTLIAADFLAELYVLQFNFDFNLLRFEFIF